MIRWISPCNDCGECVNCGRMYQRYPELYCDKCKREMDELYNYNDEQWCSECILKDCGEVEVK